MYIVIFTGAREYTPSWKIKDKVADLNRIYPGLFIKVGDCPTGVDLIVRQSCEAFNIPGKVFMAEWKKYGRAAGPKRNHDMVESGADLCLAYPNEASKGTKDCAEYAASRFIPVLFPDLPGWASWAASIASWRDV